VDDPFSQCATPRSERTDTRKSRGNTTSWHHREESREECGAHRDEAEGCQRITPAPRPRRLYATPCGRRNCAGECKRVGSPMRPAAKTVGRESALPAPAASYFAGGWRAGVFA
jgi:hypothetical protein